MRINRCDHKRSTGWRMFDESLASSISLAVTDDCHLICRQVLLWKKNVDQVFEGVEECPICYTVCAWTCCVPHASFMLCHKARVLNSVQTMRTRVSNQTSLRACLAGSDVCEVNAWVVQVIHMVNNTLPKLCCHTCKNKFHSGEALYHLRAYADACIKIPHEQISRACPSLKIPALPSSPPITLDPLARGAGSVSVQVVQHIKQECMPAVPVSMVLVSTWQAHTWGGVPPWCGGRESTGSEGTAML
jgi:hypothetical protein